MKSRKFKAVLAAVSAIAVLATAMTGFAATLNTTTTYNLADNKVSVKTVVGDIANGTQVTYLVKTAAGGGVGKQEIAYIDQKAASDGATFEWQIDRTVLSDALEAEVTVGNDAGATVTGDKTLGVAKINDIDEANYDIIYTEEYYGAGDGDITGTVVYDTNEYELVAVKLGDDTISTQATFTVAPASAANVTVVLEESEKEATLVEDSIVTPEVETEEENGVEVDKHVKLFKVNDFDSTKYEAGVYDENYRYPALVVDDSGYIVVVIKTAKGDTVSMTPYVVAK